MDTMSASSHYNDDDDGNQVMNNDENDREIGAARRRSSSAMMTPQQEQERRASIREIMQDADLTPLEKRLSIQSLMDGRRRSFAPLTSMAAAAAAVAAEFDDDSSDDDDETMQDDDHGDSTRSSHSTTSTLSAELPTSQIAPAHHLSLSASLTCFPCTDASNATTLQWKRLEQNRPPCSHYDRRCSIVSPCCGLVFGCRICHDECPVLPAPIAQSHENEAKRRHSLPALLEPDFLHHSIDRFAIQQIICRECYTVQDSKTNKCISCGIRFGEYHCPDCNLWMSQQEKPYHCSDCGFCRVGGRDNFRHCHDCGMCIDALLFENHNCKAGKYMSKCPVCCEDLFSSRFASHEMPCGHAIHWHCFKELTSYDSKCPVCKKTAETREQMAATWTAMATAISLQPVPPELARLVTILCNDCEERQENRKWHFLGVQCRNCSSFNTVVDQITLTGRAAAASDDGSSSSAQVHQQPDVMTTSAPSTAAATSIGTVHQVPVTLRVESSPHVSEPESMDES